MYKFKTIIVEVGPVSLHLMMDRKGTFEFFLNNTDLTFLSVLYKIDIKGFKNQQK